MESRSGPGQGQGVDILLATFNGLPYLPALLESLAAQTFRNWRLLVRDDGSSDATLACLEDFQARLPPGQVELCKDGLGRLGPSGNFVELLNQSSADWIFFCDQDDLWHPEKIAICLDKVRGLPRVVDGPLMVYSDLCLIDSKDRLLAPSFWKQCHADPVKSAETGRLLAANFIPGCSMGINRALKDLVLPFPDRIVMHDWYIALCCSLGGRMIPIRQCLVHYRQHQNNTVSSFGRNRSFPFYIEALKKKRAQFQEMEAQCRCLMASQVGTMEAAGNGGLVAVYLRSAGMTRIPRVLLRVRHGILRATWLHNLIYWLLG